MGVDKACRLLANREISLEHGQYCGAVLRASPYSSKPFLAMSRDMVHNAFDHVQGQPCSGPHKRSKQQCIYYFMGFGAAPRHGVINRKTPGPAYRLVYCKATEYRKAGDYGKMNRWPRVEYLVMVVESHSTV